MRKVWHEEAWEEYLAWQGTDRKTLKRINLLVKDIERNGHSGLGKPEPLRGWDGYWSRRIDDANRLVYKLEGTGPARRLVIAQCKTHYK